MTFKALYAQERGKDKDFPSPSQKFIDTISRLTKKTPSTIRMWLYGDQVPDELTISILEKHFGIKGSELFPNKKIYDNRRKARTNRKASPDRE